MEKGKFFKKLREENNFKEDLKSNPKIKNILEDHILVREGICDNALVSLIVKFNGYELNEDYIHELTLLGYIDKKLNITEKGKSFVESEETLNRLKTLVG